MKIAKLNSIPIQTERKNIIDNYYIVDDDYNFSGNSSIDVTSFESLSIFAGIGRYNYRIFRESLINNILPSFSGLSVTEKKNLILNRVYPANYTDNDIINYIGVEGLETINRTYSDSELIQKDIEEYHNKFNLYSGLTNTTINLLDTKFQNRTGINGITRIGDNYRLGGNLTGETKIITSNTKKLIIEGYPVEYSTNLSNNFGINSLVDKGFVTGYTMVYKYNAGAAPTINSNIKIFVGQAATNASGVATFEMTSDGTVNGNPIFSTIDSMTATAENNTSTLTDIPLASTKTISNGKTLTVNVVNSAGILLGGQGLELVGAGIIVNVIVIGL